MNHSIYSADRTTHIKIVVVALVAGIAVAGFGISARTNSDEGYSQTARVMKAGKAVTITSSDTSTVRYQRISGIRAASLAAPQSRHVDM